MKLVFGTRGSKLALVQTNEVISLLKTFCPELEAEVKIIKTLGDRKQDTENAAVSDKQDWIQGLDTALLDKEIDLAIHSAKDVPVDIAPACSILPVGKRLSYFDIFIPQKNSGHTLAKLNKNVAVGTASLRRKAQVLYNYPDLRVIEHRGNVTSRLEKLYANLEISGIILAEAGLMRLQTKTANSAQLSTELMLPAVNQGMLLAHFLNERKDIAYLLNQSVIPEVYAAFLAERKCIDLLDANCRSAVGVLAEMKNEKLNLKCRVLMPDGSEMIEAEAVCSMQNPEQASNQVAEELIKKGASRILIESDRGVLK